MFKRMMVLGAVASALVFTGCQSRSRQDQSIGGTGDQTQPATGGSGSVNDQDTSGSMDQSGTGGSGKAKTKAGKKGAMDAGTPGTDAGM